MEQNFSVKEIVLEMKQEQQRQNALLVEMKEALDAITPDHRENTAFRKKVITAIVGTAFLALSALGVAVLKITGIINIRI